MAIAKKAKQNPKPIKPTNQTQPTHLLDFTQKMLFLFCDHETVHDWASKTLPENDSKCQKAQMHVTFTLEQFHKDNNKFCSLLTLEQFVNEWAVSTSFHFN